MVMENKPNVPMIDWLCSEDNDLRPSFFQRFSDNLFVPFGIVMTVGCYAMGLNSLVTNRPRLGQRMMYSRVIFQGITVVAMSIEQLMNRNKKHGG